MKSYPRNGQKWYSEAVLTINNNNLQAFQLIIFARYLLGVPKP